MFVQVYTAGVLDRKNLITSIPPSLPPSPSLSLSLHCSKLQAQFQSMEVRNSCFAAFIDFFTPNTYVMVIMSDPTIRESTQLSPVLPTYTCIVTCTDIIGAHHLLVLLCI